MAIREKDTPQPPTGLSRLFYRMPIWIYRLGLGRLLGERFLLINHVGRKTGRERQAVVEVVRHDEATDGYVVASGWGTQSHWYQNLRARPEVTIQVGRRKLDVVAHFLSPEERAGEMADYARRHPTAARNLMKLIGYDVDGTEDDYRHMGREVIPFVAFRPKDSHDG